MKKKSNGYKTFTALMVATVAASVVVPVASANVGFSDVTNNNTHYDAINSLVERGIVKGFEDGTYRPNDNVTRGQAAKIIAGILGLDTKNVKNPGFNDIPTTHQYYGAIAALANAGIISGYEDDTYRPGEPVQRNHMAKIITNAFNLEPSNGATAPFTDVRADYKNYITALYENEVTTGKTTTTFDGASNVTRGQLASFVTRAENIKVDNQEQEQTMTAKISEVTATTVVTDKGTYTIEGDLTKVFNANNAATLKGAEIQVVVKKEVTASLNIVAAEGTHKLVGLKSLTLVADNTTFNAGGFKVPQLTVSGKSLEVQNVKVTTLTVVKGLTLKLSNVEASEIDARNGAKITLDATSKIGKVTLPKNLKITDVIINYNQIKDVIKEVVNDQNTNAPTPGGSGGSSSSSNLDSKVERTFTLNDISNSRVITSKGNYNVTTSLKSIFNSKNSAVLEDAEITALIVNGEITEISSITLNASGLTEESLVFDGGNATIKGNVIVNADYVALTNVTVDGDVIVTRKVVNAFLTDGLTITGELVIDEAVSPVASLNLFAVETSTSNGPNIYLNQTQLEKVTVKRNNVVLNSDLKLPEVIVSGTVSSIEVKANVERVTINVTVTIEITGNGSINQLTVEKTDIQLLLLVEKPIKRLVVPSGSNVSSIVTNYESVKDKIEQVMDENGLEVDQLAITPAEKVAAEKALLTFDRIKGINTAESNITGNLTLPMKGDSVIITWSSNNTNVIANDGTVTRPTTGDAIVLLTATITSKETPTISDTVVFNLTVKRDQTMSTEELRIFAFKEDYLLGEEFNYEFLGFSDEKGNPININKEDIQITGFDSSKYKENQEVTVTVNGWSQTLLVNILPAAPNLIIDDNLDVIVGLDNTMEYKIEGTDDWIKFDENNPPNVSGDTAIYVRFSATTEKPYSHSRYYSFREDYLLLDDDTKKGVPTNTLTFVWNVDQLDESTFTTLKNKTMNDLFETGYDILNVFGSKDIQITDVTWDNSGNQLKSTFTLAESINVKEALGVSFGLKGLEELDYWNGYIYEAFYKANDSELLELLKSEIESEEIYSNSNAEWILEYMSSDRKLIKSYKEEYDQDYIAELSSSINDLLDISELQKIINRVNSELDDDGNDDKTTTVTVEGNSQLVAFSSSFLQSLAQSGAREITVGGEKLVLSELTDDAAADSAKLDTITEKLEETTDSTLDATTLNMDENFVIENGIVKFI